MKIQKLNVGGWFQRTTLHLSEIYTFVKDGDSPLSLDKGKLRALRDALMIESVEFDVASLEYIKLVGKDKIEVKIYEDGLTLLTKSEHGDLKEDISSLTSYYETKLSPALSYLFSLGAPVPKELANIKTIYPYFVVLEKASEIDIKTLLSDFKQDKYFEVKKKTFEIYRGN